MQPLQKDRGPAGALKMRLDRALAESAAELRRAVEKHHELLDAAACDAVEPELNVKVCVNVNCPCRRLLRKTLLDTIQVLDDTRRTFKSRQLAELRQRLMKILAEQA